MPRPRLRLRTRSLLVIVAIVAVGLWGWVAYFSPSHRWQRLIHSDDESPRRWDAASKALQGRVPGIDRAEAIASLVSAMADPSPRVRQTAAYHLGTLRGPEARPAVPHLARALKDPDTSVRFYALGALGPIVETDPESRPIAEPALIGALKDRDASVRIEAGFWLTLIDRGQAAVPTLEAAVREGHDPFYKASLALGYLGSRDERSVEVLKMVAVSASDSAPKRKAILALERIAGTTPPPGP